MTTAVQVQYRRGTASQVASFTGAAGEIVVDTTNDRVVVQDGGTAGGFPAAKLNDGAVAFTGGTMDGVSIGGTTPAAAAVTALGVGASVPGAGIVNVAGSYQVGGAQISTANLSDGVTGTGAIVKKTSPVLAGTVTGPDGGSWGSGGINNSAIGGTTPAAVAATALSATGAVSGAGFSAYGGMVNKFRNGTMDVWQRGTSSLTATTSGAYTADGWIVLPTGASVTAAQAGGRLLTKNSLQVTGASSVTDLVIKQRIESLIAAAFCSQTVTVQAQVYNNTGGAITPTLTVKRPATQDGWGGSINTDVNAVSLQSCANGAWTLVSYTFAANAASYNGLEIAFDFGNNFSANTKTVQITECDIRVTPGVSTGLNSSPPPPELRHVQAELAFCQRYLFIASNIYIGLAISNGGPGSGVSLPVPMRTTPTVSNGSFSANAGNNGTFSSPIVTGANGPNSISMGNSAANWTVSAAITTSFTASAEL